MKNRILSFLIISFHFFFLNFIYSQDPGSLDLSFNGSGYNETDFGISSKIIGLGVQDDGKIIACGMSYSDVYNIALARYLPNGSLDLSFGSSGLGYLSHAFGASDETVTDMVLQGDGKILISGYTQALGSYLSNSFVARFNTDGTFDPSFSSDGIQIVDNSDFDQANSICLMDDGKILLYGTGNNDGGNSNLVVNRLHSNGQLDTGFGNSGMVNIDVSDNSYDYGEGIAVANGNIYIAGLSYADTDHIVVLCLHSTGQINSDFGEEGIVSFDMELYNVVLYNGTDLIITQDNKIAVSAFRNPGTAVDFVLIKVLMNGFPDEDFGIHGVVITDMIGDNKPFSILEQTNGDILLGGYHEDNVNGLDFTLARYLDNGDLDATFGNHYGVTWHNLSANVSNPKDVVYAMDMQEDGKIIAAGYAMGADYQNFTIARYYSGLEVGVHSQESTSEPSIYYNAQSSTINIKYNLHMAQEEIQVTVFDLSGRKMDVKKLHENSRGHYTLHLRNDVYLIPGVYLIRVQHGSQSFSKKLMVMSSHSAY